MHELSLFSGAGGGLLGTKLLGWRAVGYVERDAYCQAILEARIRDGLLDHAPIFGDIRAFLRDGWADRYRGLVDVVTAGFPCQPFSVAGRRKACGDERNLWPETAAVLERVQPAFALLENVPGLLSARSVDGHRYFGNVLGDLAALGFDAEWCVLGADDVGAPHRRKRLWILAYAARPGAQVRAGEAGLRQLAAAERGGTQGALPDAKRDAVRLQRKRLGQQRGEPGEAVARNNGADGSVADADGWRCEVGRLEEHGDQLGESGGEPDGCGARGRRDGESAGGWWECDPADEGPGAESFVGRVAHGVAHLVDRLRAIGNGQVPQCVVAAWRELYGRLMP